MNELEDRLRAQLRRQASDVPQTDPHRLTRVSRRVRRGQRRAVVGTVAVVALALGAVSTAVVGLAGTAGAPRPPIAREATETAAPTSGPTDPSEATHLGLPSETPVRRSGAAPAALRSVGEAFVAFARGAGPVPPTTGSVDLLVGGERVETLDRTDLAAPANWVGCPAAGGYAARSCPFSATTPLAEHDGPVRTTTDPPSHPCLGSSSLPSVFAGLTTLTLTPEEDLDCTRYFAVQLFVDDRDRLTAVDVVWAEP